MRQRMAQDCRGAVVGEKWLRDDVIPSGSTSAVNQPPSVALSYGDIAAMLRTCHNLDGTGEV